MCRAAVWLLLVFTFSSTRYSRIESPALPPSSLQFVILVLNMFLMMVLLWNTFAFQNGLIQELRPAVMPFVFMAVVYLASTLSLRFARVVRLLHCSNPHLRVMEVSRKPAAHAPPLCVLATTTLS